MWRKKVIVFVGAFVLTSATSTGDFFSYFSISLGTIYDWQPNVANDRGWGCIIVL